MFVETKNVFLTINLLFFFSPEQLWILNPKRILKKYEVDVRPVPKDDTAERDFPDSGG